MGMPISLALRGRHATTNTAKRPGTQRWPSCTQADRTFSTYRNDSAISRLGRGELSLGGVPR